MSPTLEKIIGVIALLGLVGFMLVLLVYVAELNLIIIATIGMLFAVYDFWRELFSRRGK